MRRFTLIELMFVIGILIILISLGSSMAIKAMNSSAEQAVKAEILQLKTALKIYNQDTGLYPVNDSGEILEGYIDVKFIGVTDGVYVNYYGEPYKLESLK